VYMRRRGQRVECVWCMYLASRSDDEGSRIVVGQKEGRRKQTGRMSCNSVCRWWCFGGAANSDDAKRGLGWVGGVYSLCSLSSHFLLKAQGAPINKLPSAPSSFMIKPAAAHLRTGCTEALP
jgi:hypothetical protein